jgi:putative ABC transport system permease protein
MRQTIRRLFRAPAFTFTVLATLGLGLGATMAVFTVVDAVLLRPLPYFESHRLVDVSHTLTVSGATHVNQSDASHLYYRRANDTLSGLAAYAATAVNLGPLRTGASSDSARVARVAAARVSASTFTVLHVVPLMGRALRDEEDHPNARPVTVIGERLWREAYGADPAILGRELEIDGVARRIVGILPARFRFPSAETQIWLPIGIDPARTDSASFDYRGVGRLRSGVSIAEAEADLQRLLLRLPEAIPGRLTLDAIRITNMRVVVRPLADVIVGNIGQVLWVVLGTVACILLIGCANLANLFLVRHEGRRTELAVRRALGAGRAAIARELLSEAAVLAAAGGALGLALAIAGVRILQSLDVGVDLPRLEEATLSGTVIGVTIGITALIALLLAWLPGLRASRIEGSSILTDVGMTATPGPGRQWARRVLIVTETALALVLVVAAGLMAQSFARLRAVELGFEPAPVYTFRMALPAAEYAAPADIARTVSGAVDALRELPGVQAAGAVTKLPLAEAGRLDTAIFIRDRPLRPGAFPNVHQVAHVSPAYFDALGISLLDGRTFEALPHGTARPEVILSAPLARRYWGNERAVGREVRIRPDGEWLTVVGVARSVRGTALEQPPDEIIYLPLAARDPRWTARDFAFVVRSRSAPAVIASDVAKAVREIAPAVPLYDTRPMSDRVAHAGARTSFLLLLLGTASVLALALASVGLFGMTSYTATLRRREIAIRLALGARPVDVRRMVVRQGVAAAAVGVVVGLAGALVAARALAALLFGISPADPATLVSAALVMTAVAAVANWLPARRASQLEPAQALRAE